MGNGKRTGKAYQPTEPQVIMRAEMEREPKSLATVFEGMGFEEAVHNDHKPEAGLSTWGQQEQRARQIAFDIIDQHELVLSLRQWQTVQNMMELAVMHGVQLQKDLPS